jgi:hypothetical protein
VRAELTAVLESPLPSALVAGSATALFCYGTCFDRRARVTEVELTVDGRAQRAAAIRMPRPDIADPAGFRGGFWGTVAIPARTAGETVVLGASVRLADGALERVELGRMAVGAAAPVTSPRPGLIAVCMATFEPDPALFATQIESLRSQTDTRWVCILSDDCSGSAHVAAIERVLDGDPRFVLVRGDRRLGFYRNFERAIGLAPHEAELIALCDQDDRWQPDKLAVLRGALGDAGLVFSDQRLVDAGGDVLRTTMWKGRRINHTDLASLLVANSVTGAATLFRRHIARLALPFPDSPGLQFHDHWIGLVALAAGDVAYVDRPLYDYVQHPGAVFGEVSSQRPARVRSVLRGGRGAYFLGYVPRVVQAEALMARCGEELTPEKRRALTRFVDAERHPGAFAWLALRPLRALIGRNETLGSEAELARGVVWRHIVARVAGFGQRAGRRLGDTRFPEPLAFEQRRLRRWRARL